MLGTAQCHGPSVRREHQEATRSSKENLYTAAEAIRNQQQSLLVNQGHLGIGDVSRQAATVRRPRRCDVV